MKNVELNFEIIVLVSDFVIFNIYGMFVLCCCCIKIYLPISYFSINFSIKNIFYDKMDFRPFYFYVTVYEYNNQYDLFPVSNRYQVVPT